MTEEYNRYNLWGSFGKGPKQLNTPEDIAVDSNGQIYITDTRNSRIQILEIKNWFWVAYKQTTRKSLKLQIDNIYSWVH